MREPSVEVQDLLQAVAAVLTAARGRLSDLCSGLPEDEAEPEGEESGPGLRSVISCILRDSIDPAIRDLLAAAGPESPAEGPPAGPPPGPEDEGPEYRRLWSHLGADLHRRLAEAERQRREAEKLFRTLLALDPPARSRSLAEDARYLQPVVVDRLLEGAREALPSNPGAAEDLATLAGEVAGRLADPDEGREGRARAGCWIAQARRIAGDEAGAEAALSAATLLALYADEQAELCRALALLRWEQGALDEAAALLERAAELWAGEEVVHEHGACRVLRALLLVDEGKARDAVGMLRDALPVLVDPWLTLYGGLALALGLAERGLSARAREQRDESARLVPRAPQAACRYARRLAGRIALALGEHDDAERLLEELRREALDRRWLPEAAVATLDLARLDVERASPPERAEERASELAATFAGTDGLEGLLPILRGFAKQLPAGESLQDFTASVMWMFLRLLRVRGVRGAPLPFT